MFTFLLSIFSVVLWTLTGISIQWLYGPQTFLGWSTGALIVEIPLSYFFFPSLKTRLFLWIPFSILSLYLVPPILLDYLVSFFSVIYPFFLLLQSAWSLVFPVILSRTILGFQESHPNFVYTMILSISGVCYGAVIIMLYMAFTTPYLTPSIASYLSFLSSAVVVITICSGLANTGVISDPAMISFFSIFAARQAIKLALPQKVLEDEWSVLYVILLNYFGPAQDEVSGVMVSRLMLFDFVVSTAISIATVISLPYLLTYDEDTAFFRKIPTPTPIDELNKFKRISLCSFGVILYIYTILNTTGNLTTNNGPLYWGFQSFIVLVGYLFYLFRTRNDDI